MYYQIGFEWIDLGHEAPLLLNTNLLETDEIKFTVNESIRNGHYLRIQWNT